jgi:hypothetical protein
MKAMRLSSTRMRQLPKDSPTIITKYKLKNASNIDYNERILESTSKLDDRTYQRMNTDVNWLSSFIRHELLQLIELLEQLGILIRLSQSVKRSH